MALSKDYISDLLYKYCSNGELSAEELAVLDEWRKASPENNDILTKLQDAAKLQNGLQRWKAVHEEVDDAWILFSNKLNEPSVLRSRKSLVQSVFFRYAAAIILLLGTGFYLWRVSQQAENKQVIADTNKPVDVAPGGNKAILTLSDGSTIGLDSVANGNLTRQGNTIVQKLSDGKLVYSKAGGSVSPDAVSYNIVTTPRGGQYQLVLPDGSKVWLNAASSLKFPVAFNGKARVVEVSGEAYFEVAKDSRMPFAVKVDGGMLVEVLGTGFNVNAYRDEAFIRTTLVEGKIRVLREINDMHLHGGSTVDAVVLVPGQQAFLQEDRMGVDRAVNVEQVVAWRNSYFSFKNATIQEVMRQLQRWYNVEVVYEGSGAGAGFTGKIGMGLTLKEVLEGINMVGVKYRIEGKKLMVTL